MSTEESARPAAQALYRAMVGAADPEATGWTGTTGFAAAPRAGQGKSVVILGAGIGGLTAAWELSRAGYACTVLEAQPRPGGRSRTARRGDRLFEIGPERKPYLTHTCEFDPGLYLNLGPGRIPFHHRRVLQYCRDFGVPLEPYVMDTTANLTALTQGASVRWRNGQIANDTRGHLAALLASHLTGDDDFTAKLRDLLRVFGDLDTDGEYHGSTRSGYAQDLDVHDFPRAAEPLKFRELVESQFWKHGVYQPDDFMWQPTLFQPVGGMDKIVAAFAQRLRDKYDIDIILDAAVTAISLPAGSGLSVHYTRDGQAQTKAADYCVSNIPLPVLRQLALDGFSPEFTAAMDLVEYAPTCKVGWQAQERFWEDDANEIYGGISRTDHVISQLWYPSNDYFSEHGTLTGAYNTGERAVYLGDLTPARRLEVARQGATALHREFREDAIVPESKGVSIAWHKVPYQLGGWAAWDPANHDHMTAYKQLLQPEGGGRFYVTGDQSSPLPGWQEGAMMSAHYVVHQILGNLPLTAPEVVRVPDARALTEGLS